MAGTVKRTMPPLETSRAEDTEGLLASYESADDSTSEGHGRRMPRTQRVTPRKDQNSMARGGSFTSRSHSPAQSNVEEDDIDCSEQEYSNAAAEDAGSDAENNENNDSDDGAEGSDDSDDRSRNTWSLTDGPGADRAVALCYTVLDTTVLGPDGSEKMVWDMGYKQKIMDRAAEALKEKLVTDSRGVGLFVGELTGPAVRKAWDGLLKKMQSVKNDKNLSGQGTAAYSARITKLVRDVGESKAAHARRVDQKRQEAEKKIQKRRDRTKMAMLRCTERYHNQSSGGASARKRKAAKKSIDDDLDEEEAQRWQRALDQEKRERRGELQGWHSGSIQRQEARNGGRSNHTQTVHALQNKVWKQIESILGDETEPAAEAAQPAPAASRAAPAPAQMAGQIPCTDMSDMLLKVQTLRNSLLDLVIKKYTTGAQLEASRQRARKFVAKVQAFGKQSGVNCVQVKTMIPVQNEEDLQDLHVLLFGDEIADDENPFLV